MSLQNKASAFPDTVQPGIPQLPKHPPHGWKRSSLKSYLYEEKRPISMKDDEEYDLVTVKRGRGGVVRRERKRGADISVKSQFEVKTGDFLISKRQIVHGACGLVPDILDGSTVSNEYAVLCSRGGLDINFLNYLSHSIYFQQTCFHSSIGVHIEKMIFKTDQWLQWKFDIPPLQEQRHIAKILSTWDRAIDATEKFIANNEAQKKALMQQLLTGKKRLPGFEGEWNPKALNVLGKTYTGLTGKTKADFGAGKPFVPYKNVFANAELDMSELEYVRLSDGEKQSMVKYGDIIFTTSSETPEEVGMSSAVLTDIGELYMNSFCFGFRIKDQNEFSPSFAKHLFRSLELRRAISSLAQGSTRYNLSKNEFLKISIQLPSRVEQEKIVEVLDAFETAHGAEQKKLQKLKVEKSALMQQLLTGKRRVAISREEAVV